MSAIVSDRDAILIERTSVPPRLVAARHALSVVACFSALYAVLFSPVLREGKLLAPGDGCLVFFTAFHSARCAWDPTMFAGFPGLADPQRLAWYPPALIAAGLSNSWNLFIVLGYVLASSFAYGYVRLLTRSTLAAAVSGLVFGMSGFLIAHLGHPNMVHSVAWLPAVLWGLEKMRERASVGCLAMTALAIAHAALAGHPQMLAYGAVCAGAYALVAGATAPSGRWRYYRAAAAAAMLGLALSAILLLPLDQLAKGSVRYKMEYDKFSYFNLPLRQLPQLIFPYAYGGMSGVPFFGEGNFTESTGYLGLLPWLLAAIAVRWADNRRLVRFWLAVAVLTLLLALGRDGGLAALVYYVPVFNKLRCPGRHLGELGLAISVLSGLGVVSLLNQDRSCRLRAAAAGSCLLALITAAAWLSWSRLVQLPATRMDLEAWRAGAFITPLTALVFGLAAFWAYATKPSWLSGSLLALAILLDMGAFARHADWAWNSVNEGEMACPPGLAKYRDEFAETGQRLTGLLSPPSTPVDAAIPNLPALWRLPTTCGYNPLVSKRFTELLHGQFHGYDSYHLLTDEDRSLDLLASRYVLAPDKLLNAECPEYNAEALQLLTSSPRFVRKDKLEKSVSFENTRAMPRAWLVGEVRQLAENEVLHAIHESRLPDGAAFEPARTALVEQSCSFTGAPRDVNAKAIARELASGQVEITSDSQSAAFCVLSDIYYPGWRATIDGVAVKIFRSNYVLMGIELPPGRHTLRFVYIPTRFYLGAAITACALVVVLGLLILPRLLLKDDAMRHACRVR